LPVPAGLTTATVGLVEGEEFGSDFGLLAARATAQGQSSGSAIEVLLDETFNGQLVEGLADLVTEEMLASVLVGAGFAAVPGFFPQQTASHFLVVPANAADSNSLPFMIEGIDLGIDDVGDGQIVETISYFDSGSGHPILQHFQQDRSHVA